MDDPNELIQQLRKKSGNNTCMDCGSSSPSWCSLTYGIFICYRCASAHRALSVRYSFVQSSDLDRFDKKNILPLVYGGNDRCRSFFESHGIHCPRSSSDPQKIDSNSVYKSDIASQYKEIILQRVENGGNKETTTTNVLSIEPTEREIIINKKVSKTAERIDAFFDDSLQIPNATIKSASPSISRPKSKNGSKSRKSKGKKKRLSSRLIDDDENFFEAPLSPKSAPPPNYSTDTTEYIRPKSTQPEPMGYNSYNLSNDDSSSSSNFSYTNSGGLSSNDFIKPSSSSFSSSSSYSSSNNQPNFGYCTNEGGRVHSGHHQNIRSTNPDDEFFANAWSKTKKTASKATKSLKDWFNTL
eukprot:TRINITY_DN3193_c2_g3_i1.p1 TRINITY_DN3193_c2_g3~~TRINITY_DN3193_c2_g3_i1.p1  ORF type:complete len:364 (-),score=94.07 TRINITY_DN3193_c2_g3_i1:56-1120(-)